MTLKEFGNALLMPFNLLAKFTVELLLAVVNTVLFAILFAAIALLALPAAIAIGIGVVTHVTPDTSFFKKVGGFLAGMIISGVVMAVVMTVALAIVVPVISLTLFSLIHRTLTGNSRSWPAIGHDWKKMFKATVTMARYVYQGLRMIGFWMIGAPEDVLHEWLQGDNAATVNYNQSAHHESVEKNVNTALLRFKDRYYYNMDKKKLEEKLRLFKQTIRESQCDQPRATTLMIAEHERKKISALACIERILNPKDEFMNRHPIKDPDPDRYQALRLVTPRDAALMIFAHMQDRENWQPQVTEKDLNNAFIDSLWHVQRGRHIDENGIDQNPYAPDNPSCAGGTINFLFNDMQAVLKDIKVNFVTQKEALSFTLPAITRRLMLEDISNQHEEQKYHGEEIIFADLPSDHQQRIRLAIKPRFYAEQKEYVEYFTERTLEKIFEDFESVALPYVTVHAIQRARFFAEQDRARGLAVEEEDRAVPHQPPRSFFNSMGHGKLS